MYMYIHDDVYTCGSVVSCHRVLMGSQGSLVIRVPSEGQGEMAVLVGPGDLDPQLVTAIRTYIVFVHTLCMYMYVR